MGNLSQIEIISEIANAHQGDPKQAAELATQSIAAGANSVKFQIYNADELNVRNHPRYSHFLNQAFDDSTWKTLLSDTKDKGAFVYCDAIFSPY